jgi:hypothetical protein
MTALAQSGIARLADAQREAVARARKDS